MGIFDRFKHKNNSNNKMTPVDPQKDPAVKKQIIDSPDCYADSSTIAEDEKTYYQPDEYYTYYSYAGTNMGNRVITFDERKKTSFPSVRGLYVAEILLLEYCSKGDYPKPKGGYPGFWWFQYGIRDVGHALESLEKRGFLRWASKKENLKRLTVTELKEILSNAGLPVKGKKTELIEQIVSRLSEEEIHIDEYIPKYELTDLGRAELEENGYVPYMHRHKHRTTEDGRFGTVFNVWSVNKLFPKGNTAEWREKVGRIEKKMFGVDMANAEPAGKNKKQTETEDLSGKKEEIRDYLKKKQGKIDKEIHTAGDGYKEESKGLDYKAIGKDKEALVQFYISIGKNFDAPALYREASVLLHKYGMYEEEFEVLELGLKNVSKDNSHWQELEDRKKRLQEKHITR